MPLTFRNFVNRINMHVKMIDTLPKDPIILLGYINTKLRDDYSSLALLCDDLNVDESELKARLAAIGYTYDSSLNKFI